LRDGQPIFDEKTGPSISSDLTAGEGLEFLTESSILESVGSQKEIKPPTVKVSDKLSMTLDEKQVVFQRGQPTNLKISGEIEDYNKGGRIYMSVTDPKGITTEHKLIGTKDGYYENHLRFDSPQFRLKF